MFVGGLRPFEGLPWISVGDSVCVFSVDGETVTARRYVVEGGGETHTLWESADGRVLRVEIPTLGWAARRRP